MLPFLLIVLVILVVVLLIWLARCKGFSGRPPLTAGATPGSTAEDPTKMPRIHVLFIVWYLILLGLALVFMEVALLAVDFPSAPPVGPVPEITAESVETTPTPEPTTAPAPQNSPAPTESSTPKPPPQIAFVIPQATVSTTPDLWVTVYGSGFPTDGNVRLNGTSKAVPARKSDTMMIARFASSDFAGRGSLTVDVVGADNTASNSVIIPVDRPTSKLNVLNVWHPPINRELQLLLVVVLAGALGTFIHILKSATAFIGNGTMKRSWFWWYITGPFVGAAMALIFYAVLRGGFLVGAPADEKFVNPFGVLVIGALVGMFSDKASLKLAEIFDTIFRSGDPRGGKLTAPTISSLDPNQLTAGLTTPQTITIRGERLGKVTVVRFNSTEVPAQVISDTEVHFIMAPEELTTAKTLQVVVVDPEAGPSASAPLTIAGTRISEPETLPDATQNTAYDQTFTAVDGVEPYQWSTSSGNLPAGLALDPASGRLSGTPTTAGTSSFTVKATDANNVSGERPYDLTVS